MKRMLMIVVLLMSIAGADTLYFKNGDVLKNCREVKRSGTYITVEYVQSGALIKNHFNLLSIDRLEPGEFKMSKESIEKSSFYIYQGSEMPETSELKLNYKMLPVSLIALILGNDYYKSIKHLDDSIDMLRQDIKNANSQIDILEKMFEESSPDFDFSKFKQPTDIYEESIKEFEKQKKEYKTKATIFFSIAIINTIFAFEKVEFQPSDSGVQISYKF